MTDPVDQARRRPFWQRLPLIPERPEPEGWERRRNWPRRRSGILTIITVCLALIAGTVIVILHPWSDDTSCADGVREVGSPVACVGVTDGSFSFSANLAPVEELIRKQNAAITGDNYVSVVYLMPLVPGPGDSNTPDSVRHELEGAYTAQYEANKTATYGDAPKIRLLLANSGSTQPQREAALDEIRSRIDPDRIVAVAGLGTSTDAAADMATTITKSTAQGGLQLGAVASIMTADSLAAIRGLVRTAPTNKDEAAAAVALLKQPAYAGKKVMIVQDVRADDQYTKTLGEEFRKALPAGRLTGQIEQYDSSQQGVGTSFATRMANLCAAEPDVVYFAGRGRDLAHFMSPLRTRPCADRKLIVLSGDDASQAATTAGFNEIKDTLESGNVQLIYTGLAHPGAWTTRGSSYPSAAVSAFRDSAGPYAQAFPEEALDDGEAIMGFDSVLTAVWGIRLVSGSPEANGRVTGSEIIQIWQNLHSVQAVPGASGYISFDESGSPTDKAVPIIEITATGAVRTLAVSAASGTPFTLPKPE